MKLIILPGLDGTGRLVDAFMAALPPSLPGIAVSYPADGPGGYEQIDQIVDGARPIGERIVIVAESFSGPLALRAAHARPEGIAGIALVATFVQSPVPWAHVLSRLAGRRLLRLATRRALVRHLLAGHDAPAELVNRFVEAVGSVSADALLARVRAVLSVDARPALRACRAPIIYLAGTRDRLVSQRSRDAILAVRPDIPIVPVDAPHLVLQRQPTAAAEIIASFCRRVERTPVA